MIRRLRHLYRRKGVRYLPAALLAMLPSAYFTGLLAASGTALYVDMSAGDYVSLVLAAWLLIWTTDVIVEARLILRLTPPINRWVGGARGESETIAAWTAAREMPYAFLKQPGMYAAVFAGIVLWDLFAVWQLDLPLYSAAIFLPGSMIVYLYWVLVRFLAIELTLRPVLEDISANLPDGAREDQGGGRGLTMPPPLGALRRTKLLVVAGGRA